MAIAPDYVDVAERIREFREKHPEGSLQQVEYHIEKIGDQHFVCYTAAAYRTPDDPCPAHGTAWEPVPGKTNFTRDSELMNAETSAWGRAIVAAGAADAKRVASANEVANRQDGDASTFVAAVQQQSVGAVDEYVFKFGKHRGTPLAEVPASYLDWLLQQPAKEGYEAQHEEQHAMFRRELHRRDTAAA